MNFENYEKLCEIISKGTLGIVVRDKEICEEISNLDYDNWKIIHNLLTKVYYKLLYDLKDSIESINFKK